MRKNLILFILASVVIATLSRLLPHPLNFTPLIGITLFSAAYLPKRWMGLGLPMLSWFVSDILVNLLLQSSTTSGWAYFITPTALGVYTSLVLVFMLGGLLRSGVRVPKLLGITVSSSLIFYLVTNSFCFFEGNLYGPGFGGYIDCMMAGIPFYKNDFGSMFGSFFLNGIMGDIFYVGVLFGSYYLVNRKSLQPAFA